jgi:Lipoproteins
MGTRLKVTNVSTGKAVVVRVNDRGAFHKYGRVIDLSYIAAKKLDMLESGVCNVKIERL